MIDTYFHQPDTGVSSVYTAIRPRVPSALKEAAGISKPVLS
jgi:hypothetical protein